MLAPSAVCPAQNAGAIKYLLKGLSLSVESLSFGDGSYRAMVDERMSNSIPLVIPFYNWGGFETSTGNSSFNQQFTLGSESVNAIIGTIRPGNYDSTSFAAPLGTGVGATTYTNTNQYIPHTGDDPTGPSPNAGHLVTIPTNSYYGWYHTVSMLRLAESLT